MNDERLEAFLRRVTLRQIEVVFTLREHKSMTATAAALGMSAANVSRVAKRFENNLGMRLFEGESRRMALAATSGTIFDILQPLEAQIGHLRSRLIAIDPAAQTDV